MGTLDDIALYLQTQGKGSLSAGTIKKSQLADEPSEQIALVLYDAGGGLEAQTMMPGLPTIIPRVQVLVRHNTYALAETKVMDVFNTLIAVQEQVLPPSNKRYIVLQPVNTPAPFQRDDQNRQVFVFNLMAAREQ
jgi:hypothetical protein